jgi:hypothetical protein
MVVLLFSVAACNGAMNEGAPDANALFQYTTDSGSALVADAGDDGTDQDSGMVDMDAGFTMPDAGASAIDAGSTVDAGASFVDAGPAFVDAGSPQVADAGPDLGDTVPNSAPVCTSGVDWLLGNVGTEVMNPGQACITCHDTNNGPKFTAAGTVYPTAHEPNNCDGKNSGWTVVITDAAGNRISLTPNLVGNFDTQNTIVFPYTVQIVGSDGYTREMLTPQSTGDCNSCHTQDGANGAPGRIVAP